MTTPYSNLKVYLAAPFEERDTVLEIKRQLELRGVIVTSTWLTDADGNSANMARIADRHNDCRMRAIKDYDDIDEGDALVLWKPKDLHREPTTGGHHTEVGYAQGKGKPVVIFGARENVFHYRPGVIVVEPFDVCGDFNIEGLCKALDVPFEWVEKGPRGKKRSVKAGKK